MKHWYCHSVRARAVMAVAVACSQLTATFHSAPFARAETHSSTSAYITDRQDDLRSAPRTGVVVTDVSEAAQFVVDTPDSKVTHPARTRAAPLPPPTSFRAPLTPELSPRTKSAAPLKFDVQSGRNLTPDLRGMIVEYARQQPGELHEEAINDSTGELDGEALMEEVPSGDRPPARQQRRASGGSRFDEDTIRQGREFFDTSCTMCHDAERATSKQKTYAAWLATVRRMAAKEDADIPANQHVPIATYLASLNPAYQREEGDEAAEDGDAESSAADLEAELAAAAAAAPPFTLNSTISTVYRGTDPAVENKGFFPDVWVNLEWQPENNPISGRIVACTSCHGTNSGLGVELAEASFTVDLCHLFCRCPPEERTHVRLAAELTAGRFIVPFGAFSGRVHPGALRTVSLPLMYNMGRRVGPTTPLQPVINLPYSDEGINLHLRREICHDWSITLDTYAVNGLQQGGGGVFFLSRSYRDNNSNTAIGGRATVGNKRLRFGTSLSTGELQSEFANFVSPTQNYKLSGADFTYRYEDLFRAYYEYAIRIEDSFAGAESYVYGNLAEVEILLSETSERFPDAPVNKVSFLARYDTLKHGGALGQMETERLTYGLNLLLHGGSLLILDHEHWIYQNAPSINIFGLRWTATF